MNLNFNFGRMPPVMITGSKKIAQGFNFIVTLNEFTYGFQEVSEINVKRPLKAIEEGGVNDHGITVGEPDTELKTLTFKRGMVMKAPAAPTSILRAMAAAIPVNMLRKIALVAVNALDPQEALESGPAIGTIQVYSRNYDLMGLFGFLSLGMTEWSLNSLNSTNGEVLIEEFTVAHTGISRIPVTWMPAFGNAVMNLTDELSTQKTASASVNENQRASQPPAEQKKEEPKNEESKPPTKTPEEIAKEKEEAAEDAEVKKTVAQSELNQAEKELEDLKNSGTASPEEIKAAEAKVENAQKKLDDATKNAENAQNEAQTAKQNANK